MYIVKVKRAFFFLLLSCGFPGGGGKFFGEFLAITALAHSLFPLLLSTAVLFLFSLSAHHSVSHFNSALTSSFLRIWAQYWKSGTNSLLLALHLLRRKPRYMQCISTKIVY